jgi:shikimate kinase
VNVEPLNANNVFLIGYRCTGKSSVGKLLAARLGWHFTDTDSLLVAEKQASIREIVENCGWQAFRKFEYDIVRRICDKSQLVVATGGGVVLNDANVAGMKAAGKIVWLRATPQTLRKRMMQDTDTEAFRPALTSKDSIAEIEETLLEREPCYRRAMDFLVDTDGRRIDEICEAIMRQLVEPHKSGFK